MWSQERIVEPCGLSKEYSRVIKKYPFLLKTIQMADQKLEEETQDYIANRTGGDNEIFIIPMVFHVIHNGGNENITDEQIYSAVDALNDDFRLLNEDIVNVPDAFIDIASDIEIEFRLAQRDPEGLCTKGINRIQSSLTYEGDSEMKSLINWPRDMYLNIWVCAEAGDAAGYTFYPGSVDGPWMADEDGIVIRSDYTGTIGTSTTQRSTTLTHECGHWLNLRHTWGNSNSPGSEANCDMDDNVDDTPNTTGTLGGCDMTKVTCGSLDNVNNYMEYTSCKFMFTEGQRTRMRAAIQSSTAERNELWQESNLINTGVFEDNDLVCKAEFYVNRSNICVSDTIEFEDDSFHGITEWSWDFGDGTVIEGADPEIHQNPQHAYAEPGFYNVTLTVGDGTDSASQTKEDFIQVYQPDALDDLLVEGFENDIDDETWTQINFDEDDVTWELTNTASYSGETSMRLRNRFVDIFDATDEFITATFDFSEQEEIIINYKWAFALKSDNTDDRFIVSTSSNCGFTWTIREVHRGQTDLPTAPDHDNNFVPDGLDEWTEETIVIDDSLHLTDNFRVRFEFNGRGGNNFYLDDINIGNEIELGIDDLSLDQFISVFPNPAQDQFQVIIEKAGVEKLDVRLMDVSGRIVLQSQEQGKSFTIPRNDISSGYYMLHVQQGANQYMKKILFE